MKSFLTLSFLFVLFSCTGDDDNYHFPDTVGEEITRVRLSITNEAGDTSIYEFDSLVDQDADQVILKPNSAYTVSLSFWNDKEGVTEDITDEVRNESDEHLVCFTPLNNTNVTISRTDHDPNGLEIGLESLWQTGSASNGGVLVILKHQPDLKEFLDEENCQLGETDVQVPFPVLIQ